VNGFKAFLMRGNVVDLAVAVVIGAAFTTIVNAFVTGIINPVVGLFGTKNLDQMSTCIKACGAKDGGVVLHWGSVVGAALTFVMTAAVVYFLLVMPMNRMNERRKKRLGIEPETASPTEVELLEEIRDLLRGPVDTGDNSGATAAPRA
jgi:large conductance mechanosensitive channel